MVKVCVADVEIVIFCGVDDDPKTFQDAPVGLQLVGRKYEDEKVNGPSPFSPLNSLPFPSSPFPPFLFLYPIPNPFKTAGPRVFKG